jgi:hypothetical protein
MFHKEQQACELSEETESHLEMLTEEKRKQGISATEARNAALREFGGVSQMREKYREMSGLKAVEILAQDLRYSFRMLRRNPRICRRDRSPADSKECSRPARVRHFELSLTMECHDYQQAGVAGQPSFRLG